MNATALGKIFAVEDGSEARKLRSDWGNVHSRYVRKWANINPQSPHLTQNLRVNYYNDVHLLNGSIYPISHESRYY